LLSFTGSRPARLVACSEAGSIVAVEILVEQKQISPVRIVLKLARASVDRTLAVGVRQESGDQPVRNLFPNLIQVQIIPRVVHMFATTTAQQVVELGQKATILETESAWAGRLADVIVGQRPRE